MTTTVYYEGEIAKSQNLFEISFPLTDVPQYDKVASPQTVVFDHGITSSGSQIALDEATGTITLDSGSDYVLSAVVNTTRALPPSSAAGCQWYNVTDDAYLGSFTKFGQTCTAIVTAGTEIDVVLHVFSDTATFEYPNQLVDSAFTVQLSVPV